MGRILDMARTTVNVWSDATATAVMDASMRLPEAWGGRRRRASGPAGRLGVAVSRGMC